MQFIGPDGQTVTVSGTEAEQRFTADPRYAPSVAQPFPDGEPDKSWKSAELKEYAAAHEIDLGGATTKSDILAAIAAA